jgi:hypothetical protein
MFPFTTSMFLFSTSGFPSANSGFISAPTADNGTFKDKDMGCDDAGCAAFVTAETNRTASVTVSRLQCSDAIYRANR